MSPKEQHIINTYELEKPRLTGYIRKSVPTTEDAEDIAQDVFMSLTDGFDDILNLSSTISWLYAVAKKKIIDFKRKKKNYLLEDQKQMGNDDGEPLFLSDLLSSTESLPDDQLMEDLIWEEIQASLDLLPLNQREVFIMHELDGLSFQEISVITGGKVNTLLSRKRYAILFLREQLRELFDSIHQ